MHSPTLTFYGTVDEHGPSPWLTPRLDEISSGVKPTVLK